MPVLGTATRVYGGSTAAVKVYMGATLAWPLTPVPAMFVFPNVTGNYLTTPDAAPLRLTGDFEFVVRVQPTTWRPAANKAILARYLTTGDQRSYRWYLGTTGALSFVASLDGINALTVVTSSTVVPDDGAARWLKLTRVQSTGIHKYFTAPDATTEPTTWTQLGSDRTGTTSALFPGTAPLTLGGYSTGSDPWAGRMWRAILRNGVGGSVVFDMNEDDANANVPAQFTATSGHVVSQVVTASNKIIQPRSP